MLNNVIPAQRFELIRDAVGRVLTSELANQKVLGNAEDINIFLERTCPIDKEELPVINILYAQSDFTDETTSVTSLGDNKYLIEVYTSSESTPSASGDKASAVLLAKIAGMIRAILMNQDNLYLDFVEKFIQNRKVKDIVRTQPRITGDSENTISGILEVHYWAEEETELGTGNVEAYLLTNVKISDTEKGYRFVISNS